MKLDMKNLFLFLVTILFFQSCKITTSLEIDDYCNFENELIPKIIPYTKIDSWSCYSYIRPWDIFTEYAESSLKEMGYLIYNAGYDTIIIFNDISHKFEIYCNLCEDIPYFIFLAYNKNNNVKIIDENCELRKFIGYIDNIQEAVLVLLSHKSSYYPAISDYIIEGSASLEFKKTRKFFYFPVDYNSIPSNPNRDVFLNVVNRDYKYVCKVSRFTQEVVILKYKPRFRRFIIGDFKNTTNSIPQ